MKLFSSQEFRKNGHSLVDIIGDYLEDIENGVFTKAIPFIEPEESLDFWQKEFDSERNFDVLDFFKTTFEKSTKLHDLNYMGHQVAVPSAMVSLSGLLTGFLNNGGAIYEMGMVSNTMERLISKRLAEKIGYNVENADGFLTSGGTIANTTALLAARARYSKVWTDGSTEKLGVMVSEEAHYCIDRAAKILGFGEEGVIKIKSNSKFQAEVGLLENYYHEAIAKGIRIIAIVGSACSTSTGSYDDLDALGDFAREKDIWFHVDGAHGAAVVFSEKYKYLLKGIAKSDSVTLDWHKLLHTPGLTTSLVFREGKNSYATFDQKAVYLWDDSQDIDWFNVGKRTFECTKLMMAVKVYTLLKYHGEKELEESLNIVYDLSREFYNFLSTQPDFEVVHQPESNILCFGFRSEDVEINAKIRRVLLQKGEFYVVQTNLRGKIFMRVALMNPRTQMTNLLSLVQEIRKVAKEVLS